VSGGYRREWHSVYSTRVRSSLLVSCTLYPLHIPTYTSRHYRSSAQDQQNQSDYSTKQVKMANINSVDIMALKKGEVNLGVSLVNSQPCQSRTRSSSVLYTPSSDRQSLCIALDLVLTLQSALPRASLII
jgi:hypothetical protein